MLLLMIQWTAPSNIGGESSERKTYHADIRSVSDGNHRTRRFCLDDKDKRERERGGGENNESGMRPERRISTGQKDKGKTERK